MLWGGIGSHKSMIIIMRRAVRTVMSMFVRSHLCVRWYAMARSGM